MNPNDLKQAWQSQPGSERLSINPDLLVREVRRNHRNFAATIFWRDVREVGVSLVMIPVWFYLGAKFSLPWTWYLTVPALLWVACFMVYDRLKHNRIPPDPSAPLKRSVEVSLAHVEHQAWLLRNVFWWYLLPPGVALLAFFGHVLWTVREMGWSIVPFGAFLIGFEFAVLGGVYLLNQYAVRKELEPRRQELLGLLASLSETVPPGERIAPIEGSVQQSSSSKFMKNLGIIITLIATLALSVWAQRMGTPVSQQSESFPCPAFGDAGLTNILVSVRNEHGMPSIAAALVTSKGIELSGVAGTRKKGTDVPAGTNDLWHLGSDCKAMTATLVAKLVEKGSLKWDTTVAEVFPDLAESLDPAARQITVSQLLSHRSGLKPNPSLLKYRGADGTAERLRVLKEELGKPLKHKPGSHFEYSNLGYSIVGAITERITGKTWEQAMRAEVFGPLGMKSVGFGGTGTPGELDQPWPHDGSGNPVRKNGPDMDNPPVLSPAGRVHCTIQDWALFITDQLRGARGEPALLKPESYKKLHTPPFGGEYALGWMAIDRDWGGGKVLHHAGDNTMNFANVWVAPRKDFAVLVCVNRSGDKAFTASDEVVGKIIEIQAGRRRSP
jgi:CubicO group peptidase (beta-lactamase class C family)